MKLDIDAALSRFISLAPGAGEEALTQILSAVGPGPLTHGQTSYPLRERLGSLSAGEAKLLAPFLPFTSDYRATARVIEEMLLKNNAAALSEFLASGRLNIDSCAYSQSQTMLMEALQQAAFDCVDVLLSYRPNVALTEEWGGTALTRLAAIHPEYKASSLRSAEELWHWQQKTLEAIERLRVKPVADHELIFALTEAASRDHVEMARWLLSRGADPAREVPNGTSALSYAASSNSAKVLQLFLDHGTDPKACAPCPWAMAHAGNADKAMAVLEVWKARKQLAVLEEAIVPAPSRSPRL